MATSLHPEQELIEILSEVFAGKADYHEPEVVAAFFAERPDLLRELHEPKHQVILGRRGTGKTMVLKYLSLPAQLHHSGTASSGSPFPLDFIGFYVSLALELQPTIGPEDDNELAPVFGHWFNLVSAIPVLDVVDTLQAHGAVSQAATKAFVSDFSKNILGKQFREMDPLREWINGQVTDVLNLSYLVKDHSIRKQKAYGANLPRLTSPRSFHAQFTALLSEKLEKLFRLRPRFFFLLDRFDEVSAERQNVVKQIIQSQQGQLYYVKLGVAHRDKLHLAGLTLQDYRIINIEHRLIMPAYVGFCEKVLQKRFEAIRQKVTLKGINPQFGGIFSDPATLLPCRSFEEQARLAKLKPNPQGRLWRKSSDPEVEAFRLLADQNATAAFSGIMHLAEISSGCIRIFIETTHQVVRHALLTSANIILEKKSIPIDIQHEAIVEESNQRFSQELRASISATVDEPSVQEATVNLMVFLLREFRRSLDKSEWGVHCFELQDALSPVDDKVLIEAITALERLGFMTPADGGHVRVEAGTRFTVSRIFAPRTPLPPRSAGCLIVTGESLRHAIDPNHLRSRSSRETSLNLMNDLKCFYATGFRHDWENSLRQHLRDTVFPKYQLNYSDGEDYHSESQQIGRSVGGLLEGVDFFIAEISDQNENVCYEMGLGIALGKWFCRIKNTRHRVGAADPVVEEVLNSLKYDTYQYDPSTKSEDGRINMLTSVDRAISQIASRFRKLPSKDREKVNPFQKDRALHLIEKSPVPMLFMFADQSENMNSWISDFKRNVMEELNLLVCADASPAYRGPNALNYLERIARSTHSVIDITNKSKFGAFLLGYAVGLKRYHLAVWRQGTDSLITSYRGEAGRGEYRSKEELWNLIRKFLQSPPDVS